MCVCVSVSVCVCRGLCRAVPRDRIVNRTGLFAPLRVLAGPQQEDDPVWI